MSAAEDKTGDQQDATTQRPTCRSVLLVLARVPIASRALDLQDQLRCSFLWEGNIRIVRFQAQEGPRYGIVEDEAVYALQGDLFGAWNTGRRIASLEELRNLPPCTPSKVVAVGRNYCEHAQETHSDAPEEPLIFLKPATAVIAHLDPIVYPAISQRVDHEGELALRSALAGAPFKPGQPVSQSTQPALSAA